MSDEREGIDVFEAAVVHLIEVKIERGQSGLYYGTSEDLQGLLVAKPSKDDVIEAIPQSIYELFAVRGERDIVVVRASKRRTTGRIWAVITKSKASVEADIAKLHAERLATRLAEVIGGVNLDGLHGHDGETFSVPMSLTLIEMATVDLNEYMISSIGKKS